MSFVSISITLALVSETVIHTYICCDTYTHCMLSFKWYVCVFFMLYSWCMIAVCS